MKTATIQLETLTCPSCLQKIEGALKKLSGVQQESVEVLFNSSRVRLNFLEERISLEEIEEAISKIGYEVQNSKVKPSRKN